MFAGMAHAATAINDVYTFTESANTPFQLPVVQDNDDYAGFPSLEITEVFSGDISWFSIVDPGDGVPEYVALTPGAAFTTGVIEFNYKVTDSNGASEGFVSVNVIADAAFSLADDSFFVGAGQSITFDVTDNDTLPTEYTYDDDTSGVTLGVLIDEAAIGRYTFNAGSVSGSTSFTYTADAVPAQTGTVTIFVDAGTDPKSIITADTTTFTVNEGGAQSVVLTRSGSTQSAISIDISLAGSSTGDLGDFTLLPSTVSWAAGESGSKAVTLSILVDTEIEVAETLVFDFVNATGGAEYSGASLVATIPSTDGVNFSAATQTVNENGASATVTVNRTGTGAGAASIAVQLNTGSTTATLGSDFTFTDPTTLSWTSGETGSKTVTIPITYDSDNAEATEKISLDLVSASNLIVGATSAHTVDIVNVAPIDVVSFVSASYSVAEGDGSVTVQAQRVGAGSGVASVNVALSATETAAEGVDFTYPAVVTLSWADGEMGTKDVVIPIVADSETEGAETFSLELLDPPTNATTGTVKITQVTITNVVPLDEVGLVLTEPNVTEGGQITVEVTRTGGGSGAASVTLGVGAESVAELDADLSVATGSSLTVSWADGDTATQSVVFDVTADSLLEEVEAVLFELSAESNVTLGAISTISGTIADDGSITVDDLDAIGFVSVAIRAAEEVGEVVVQFVRTGAGVGVVEATVVSVLSETLNEEVLEPTIVKTVPAQGDDFTLPANATLQWADGEVGVKTLVVQISPDTNTQIGGIDTDPDGEYFSLKIDPDSLVGNIAVNEDSAEAEVVIYAQARLGDLVEEGSPVREVADAIDGLCSASSADEELDEECDQLNALDASEIETALEQVLPKTVEAQIRSAVELAGNQLQNMRRRLTELRSGRNQVSVNGLNMTLFDESVPLTAAMQSLIEESKGGAAGADEGGLLSSPWGVFINGTITVGDQDDTDGSIGYDVRSRGITAGVDYRISRTMVLGGALGFGESDTDFNQSAGSQGARNLTLTVFGNHFINDKIYADWIVSYTKNDFDIERSFEVLSGSTHQVEASPEGHQYSIAVGGGYDYVRGALQVTGFGRIDYIMSVIDSYEESGSIYALILDEQEADSLETAFGVKTSYVFSTKRSVLIPTVELEWVHQYAGDDRQIEAAFAVAPSAGSFSVETESSDDDYLNAGFSFTGTFSGGTSGYFRYDTLVNESDRSRESYTLGGRYEF
ncbi:hypothetical protein A9Q99_04080 [Gammaproteobacteria bacterium 45_16_T64]|nr:hypothetical protein A9Q99_04080 [Gammaproteobacteria bacterium 45_16_T64]